MNRTPRPTVNRDAAGTVRYQGYDPESGDCHFAVDLSKWANGNLAPIPAARLMNAAPELLAALKELLKVLVRVRDGNASVVSRAEAIVAATENTE